MDMSLFLAKFIGLYLLIVSVLVLFKKPQMEAACKDLASSRGALAVSAELSLLFGLVIAIDHSMWEMSYQGLITLLGYLMILRGIIRFVCPERIKAHVATLYGKGYPLIPIILGAVGAYLTYCGFMGC